MMAANYKAERQQIYADHSGKMEKNQRNQSKQLE
jgi:hypothetical protein